MRRILISDELAAILAATDKDATAAIGRLNQSYVFAGAAYAILNGTNPELLVAIQKVPTDKLKYFLDIAEVMLEDIIHADKIEIKE